MLQALIWVMARCVREPKSLHAELHRDGCCLAQKVAEFIAIIRWGHCTYNVKHGENRGSSPPVATRSSETNVDEIGTAPRRYPGGVFPHAIDPEAAEKLWTGARIQP